MAMTNDFAVKRNLANQVAERVRSGKCLVCDEKAARRGLCMNHYQLFLRRREARGSNDAVQFEAAAIREGKVLPVGRMRELKSVDPFADL
jgi:hypothetical protein